MFDYITIDFETFRIKARPHYPPVPVGVSIKWPRQASNYLRWGHPEGNNCTEEEARAELQRAVDSGLPIVFHNAKFDLAVMYEYFGFKLLAWHRVHDTMFLAFLADPHSKAIDLKGLAEEWLDWKPEERDAIAEWVWENRTELKKLEPDVKIGKVRGLQQATPTATAQLLAYAPGEMVGAYAEGDTDRTSALFDVLYPLIEKHGMLPAYNRERRVLPIFMENERIGIRVDVEALERDVPHYQKQREIADNWLRERLNDPDLNIDSDDDFAAALAREGIVDDDKWTMTAGSKKWRETGGKEGTPPKRSVSKKNLTPDMYNDPEVASVFGYRNRLTTCLGMFMVPWLEQAKQTNGYIHTSWNQTRGADGGTRTGRPSTSKPNLLNISKEFKEGPPDFYVHPTALGVEPLPLVREYVLPDNGCVFVHRDFDGQELRIFGDVEEGDLFRSYQENPKLDVHAGS